MSSFLFFIAIIPVVMIMLYVYSKDRNKEPTKLLAKLFLFGTVSCFLTIGISEILEAIFPFFKEDPEKLGFFQAMISVFIGIALVEEFSKWLMAYLIGYKSEELDEIYDSIVYAMFVSLGFACFENILYLLDYQSIVTGVVRGIVSVPGHACYGLYMGYFLAMAKLYSKKGRPEIERIYLVLSVIVPAILHGIYDFCLMANFPILVLVFLLFVILLFTFSVRRLNILSKDLTRLAIKNKYCRNCGLPVKAEFCSNCGTRQE